MFEEGIEEKKGIHSLREVKVTVHVAGDGEFWGRSTIFFLNPDMRCQSGIECLRVKTGNRS